MADLSWATSILVAVITLVLSRKLLSFISFSARSRRNGCKAPARYPHKDPVLGLDYFMTQMKERKEGNSLAGQRDRFARLGHTYEVNSWGTRTIQTMDPQNIREVLVTSFDKFGVQEMRLSVGMPFIGPGVFSTDGRYWAISRKMIQPAFSGNPFSSDFEAFDVHVDRMLKRLPRDGSTIELQSLLKFMYLDHSTDMIFGKSTDILLQKDPDESSSELLETFSAALSRLGLRIFLGRLWIFNAWDKTYEALARRIHAVIDKYIDEAIERRRQQRENSRGQPDPYRRIIVDSLLAISGNREEVRDQLVNIFLPARDAAAVGLSACLFHLARHPDVWNKLRAEVLSIQGPLTRQALLSLPYMQAVLNESLRLNAPAAGNRRRCTQDCVLPTGGGRDGKSPVFVSKGDGIEVVMGAMHYDQEIWGPDADKFRPERWLEGNAEELSSFYMPFSIGKRICPGKDLTLAENSYVIARLMRQFKSLENRDPVTEFVELSKLTTESRNGVLVGLIPEDAS